MSDVFNAYDVRSSEEEDFPLPKCPHLPGQESDDEAPSPKRTRMSVIPLLQRTLEKTRVSSITSQSIAQPSTSTSITQPTISAGLQKKKNPIWKYFGQDQGKECEAICNICGRFLKRGPTKTTSPLIKHLALHTKEYKEYLAVKQQCDIEKKRNLQIPSTSH